MEETEPNPLPRVRLDLAALAANAAFLPTWEKPTEAQQRRHLEYAGWVEADGWWTAPDELELGRKAYAVTEREEVRGTDAPRPPAGTD